MNRNNWKRQCLNHKWGEKTIIVIRNTTGITQVHYYHTLVPQTNICNFESESSKKLDKIPSTPSPSAISDNYNPLLSTKNIRWPTRRSPPHALVFSTHVTCCLTTTSNTVIAGTFTHSLLSFVPNQINYKLIPRPARQQYFKTVHQSPRNYLAILLSFR